LTLGAQPPPSCEFPPPCPECEPDVVDEVVDEELGVVVVVVVVVVVGGGPVETTMLTELPGGTEAPGPGFVAMI
jgi:hypothetical protein